jgi:hypothetical protein
MKNPKTRAVLVWAAVLALAFCGAGCKKKKSRGSSPPSPQVTVQVRASGTGLTVTVDGVQYAAPASFTWTAGSQHTLAVTSPQAVGAVVYTWNSWSDGGALTHTVSPSANSIYTASFTGAGMQAAVRDWELDSGGGEAVVTNPVSDEVAVWASVAQGAAHSVQQSTASSGSSRCEAGFIGAAVAVETLVPIVGGVHVGSQEPEEF